MQTFIRYFWNTIVRPRANVDALAAERTVRWAVAAAALPVLQVWGNVALHALLGLDWLGTRPLLADPTFVGGYGQWRVDRAGWVPLFVALMPLLAALNLVLYPGIAQLVSKLWGGQGTFEQMVNTLTFATVVPHIVVAGISEWLFSAPMDLITGTRTGGRRPWGANSARWWVGYGTPTFGACTSGLLQSRWSEHSQMRTVSPSPVPHLRMLHSSFGSRDYATALRVPWRAVGVDPRAGHPSHSPRAAHPHLGGRLDHAAGLCRFDVPVVGFRPLTAQDA